MNRNMQPKIHRSATTYSVQNSISDTLPVCPAFQRVDWSKGYGVARLGGPPVSASTLLTRSFEGVSDEVTAIEMPRLRSIDVVRPRINHQLSTKRKCLLLLALIGFLLRSGFLRRQPA